MSMLDAFFGHDHTMTIHGNVGDTHIHYHPDGMGGHQLLDDAGNLIGRQNVDALGHLHTYDAHGAHLGETHVNALGQTVMHDAHGMQTGILSHGPLGDLFLDSGTHLGQMGHDLFGNAQLTLDPLVNLGHFQFPHFAI